MGHDMLKSNAVGTQSDEDDDASTADFEFDWVPDDDAQEGL